MQLQEFPRTSQDQLGQQRRWFHSQGADLYIWTAVDCGTVTSFQFCFEAGGQQLSVTWQDSGFVAHDKIDEGGALPNANRTPICVPNDQIDHALVTEQFNKRSANLEPKLRDFVLARLDTAQTETSTSQAF